MIKPNHPLPKLKFRFGVAAKLGIILASFGVIASIFTGYSTYRATSEIITQKAENNILLATQVVGRRFSILADEIGRDATFLADTELSRNALSDTPQDKDDQKELADLFKKLLAVNTEYFQIRLISASQNGIEKVRLDRDVNGIIQVKGDHLQEKAHYPYVFETLKLERGQIYFSPIFINNEEGAHAGLNKPTLQVATPVTSSKGKNIGVIVINVDLNSLFKSLNDDLGNKYQLYLTNQKGDYLINPSPSKTFGFDYGRRFLIQDDFPPVTNIVNEKANFTSFISAINSDTPLLIGGFARIPFGSLIDNRFVILGLSTPLNKVLPEKSILIRNGSRIVLICSLLAMLLSMIIAIIFVRPIKHMVTSVHRFSNTHVVSRNLVHTNDEIGLLSETINQMQRHILSDFKTLDNQNNKLIEEIEQRKKLEKFEAFRSHILEMIASNTSIETILLSMVEGVEMINPDSMCSILLLDSSGQYLVKGIAPKLPTFFNEAVEGAKIGDAAGSCGTAAFTGKRVIVEDIETHPFWKDYKDIALKANLRSCWSQPICSASGKVLGTFAIYHNSIDTPSEYDLKVIEQSAYIASIAIEHKQAETEINNLAFYDTLTQLPNRRLLLDRLKQALFSYQHSHRGAALLFIDLDNFKSLNDSMGHDMGDLLLQKVAERLCGCVRESDTISRLGGDEFVIILEDLSTDPMTAATQTENVGQKILLAFKMSYKLASHEITITPSVGISVFKDGQQTEEELMKQADIAMYEAKRAGGNLLRFFDPDMQASVMARVNIENALRIAIAKGGQFQLYYQPQVMSDKVVGAEALIRWKSPEHGLIPPTDFISISEDSGLIFPIGHWVLLTACHQLKSWANKPESSHLSLAVNISARQIRLPTFVEEVLEVVTQTDIDPSKLKLEITERIFLEDVDTIIDKMRALKARGIQFSIDDYGTGYTSLQYLKRLPIDQLKIDQSFVRDIATDIDDNAIVGTIVAMAQRLKLDVIAEGVETEVQKELLIKAGCHQYQGYWFGKPMPIDEFNALLKPLEKTASVVGR
jgi:diguanylate cyclase (GGDEF)-like protein